MKKLIGPLLLMLLMGHLFVFAGEIIVEIIPNSYGLPLAYVYQSEGKEIARQKVSAARPFSFDQIPKNIPDGVIKFCYSDGTRIEVPRKNGKISGMFKTYYPNGKLKFEENYVDGVVSGISKDYYENGQLAEESSRQNGSLQGMRKVFYENGTLKTEENYVVGKRLLSRSYAQDGKLSMEEIEEGDKYVVRDYEDGRLAKEKIQKGPKVISVKEYGKSGNVVSGMRF